jgi:hypothetical protein
MRDETANGRREKQEARKGEKSNIKNQNVPQSGMPQHTFYRSGIK